MITGAVHGAFSQERFALLPVGHWSYRYIDLLQERGLLGSLPWSMRPLNRYDVAQALARLNEQNLDSAERAWFQLLRREFRVEFEQLDETATTRIGASAASDFSVVDSKSDFDGRTDISVEHVMPHFTFSARGRIDGSLIDDTTYDGRHSRNFGARMEDAVGFFHTRHLFAYIGRFSENWGPFDRSLILSSNPYSFDKIGLGFRSKRIAFRSFVAQLDDIAGARRFATGHRLDIVFPRGIQLGLSETVVYGNPGQHIDFAYLNPFTLFADAQLNDKKEANENISIDAVWPTRRVITRFQFLIDDFILDGPGDPPPNTETSPHRLGWAGSVTLHDVAVKQSRVEIFYSRLGTHTYNVKSKRPWQSYTYRDRGLGWPYNDGDHVALSLTYLGVSSWLFETEWSYHRQGQRRLVSHDFDDSTFVKSPTYPSGVVEKTLTSAWRALYQPNYSFDVQAAVMFNFIRNKNHVTGRSKEMAAQLTVRYSWWHPFRDL
jgi:hypothetical protein